MSSSATGRLVDEHGAPIVNPLRVVVCDESGLDPPELNSADSGSDGRFTVTYNDDSILALGTRKLGIFVFTQSHRQLYHDSKDDQPNTLPLGDIKIPRAEATGWTVTLGGSSAQLPVRDGNAVRVLIDNETAWGLIKDAMLAATTSIDVMQLEFDVPNVEALAGVDPEEPPEIVLSFADAVDPLNPRAVNEVTDYRPELLLRQKAAAGLKVRILMSSHSVNWATLGVDVFLMLIPLLLILALDVGRCWKSISKFLSGGPGGSFGSLKKYLDAVTSSVDAETFKVTLYNVVHAKLVMIDDKKAIVVGSPFNQGYWDTHDHNVFEPRRGSASGEPVPVHDVSLAVRGPAVKDMHDAFRLHWNSAEPGAPVAEIPVAAPIGSPAFDEDAIASLQLVRTLNGGAFGLDKGEQGILEAYLRAIEMAQTYIYLENQYFTNETIGKALVAALKRKVQIIVMLNVTPDVPMYPVWQSNLIERIRKDAGTNASLIEFFTAWTHNPPISQLGHTNPMIMANYVHTKAAIVDGLWATVGSANLDGASLDAFQLLHALQFGDNRNHEVNYLIFNGIDGHPPAPGAGPDAIDLLRRRLWSEHLGMDAQAPSLKSTAANNAGWLDLWTKTADRKRSALATNPATIDPTDGRVLRYPPSAITGLPLLLPWTNPERDFLKSSQIPLDNLDLVEQVLSFQFSAGSWKK
jgi:phosphatidylserine/phosphatidylglycerophosphate/cardiolipin synthase-like enzyme